MRKPQFDVPEAMKHIYNQLEQAGFHPRVTISPSEWDHPNKCWVRFLHVHGDVEVTLRPFGKKIADAEQKWRISPADNGIVSFQSWLDGIMYSVRQACQP